MTFFRIAGLAAFVLGAAAGPSLAETCTIGSSLPWCPTSAEFVDSLDVQSTDQPLAVGSALPSEIETVEVAGGEGYEVARVGERIVVVRKGSREIVDLVEVP